MAGGSVQGKQKTHPCSLSELSSLTLSDLLSDKATKGNKGGNLRVRAEFDVYMPNKNNDWTLTIRMRDHSTVECQREPFADND
eukprot:g28320.t1